MADRYVGLIAQGLKEVHPLLGDASFITDRNDNFPDWDWDGFYNELSWLGLYDTVAGQEHLQNPNYTADSNLYVVNPRVDSTKNPKCD